MAPMAVAVPLLAMHCCIGHGRIELLFTTDFAAAAAVVGMLNESSWQPRCRKSCLTADPAATADIAAAVLDVGALHSIYRSRHREA